MKKQIPSFAAGVLTMTLVGGLGVSALAAAGAMTITVDPINVQVNGQVFQPKDANGQDVPVFSYNGTTYAPLRALAEAYGLEVGYDARANMATVTGDVAAPESTIDPDITAYSLPDSFDSFEDFKSVWTITSHGDSGAFSAAPIPEIENDLRLKKQFKELWNKATVDKREKLLWEFLEYMRDQNDSIEYLGFIFDGKSIGDVYYPDTGYIVVEDIL